MPTNLEKHRCELCDQVRELGSVLVVKPGSDAVWVCQDCQRKLALRVDDESTPGD